MTRAGTSVPAPHRNAPQTAIAAGAEKREPMNDHIQTPAPARRRFRAGRLVAGSAIAAGLVLAAPAAAQAHVTATPDADAAAGAYGVLTFAFSHGCDGSPTTALEIEIPDGLASVTPTIEPGWDVALERDGENGPVSRIVYTAAEPVADGYRATVDLGVQYAQDAAGRTLAFPVNQVCEVGNTSWSEIPEEGQDPHDLDAPAPTVAVGEATEEGGHDHGSGDTAHEEGESADAAATSASSESAVLPVVLATSGLVLGAAALVVALLALRRRA